MKYKTAFRSLYLAFLMALFTMSFSIMTSSRAIAQAGARVDCVQLAMTRPFTSGADLVATGCGGKASPLRSGAWLNYISKPNRGDRIQAQYMQDGQWVDFPLWGAKIKQGTLIWWIPPQMLNTQTTWRWMYYDKANGQATSNTFTLPKNSFYNVGCIMLTCRQVYVPPQ